MDELKTYGIGRHISKNKSYINTFTKWCQECRSITDDNICPTQIFSGSPKSYNRSSVSDSESSQMKELIAETGLNFFIHSIYLLNLCRPRSDNERAYEYFKKELIIGSRIDCKGVVVHVGKRLKFPMKLALDTMYQNMVSLAEYSTEECPILLETPAGQGTETLVKYGEFLTFYQRFTEDQRNKIKICIDTCHVYAAGHCPLKYIQDWYSQYPESIVLIHFNDSKCECGTCKDRHDYPGNGCIGLDKMMEVADFCNSVNLPMVYE